jgi:hypothetical protein
LRRTAVLRGGAVRLNTSPAVDETLFALEVVEARLRIFSVVEPTRGERVGLVG